MWWAIRPISHQQWCKTGLCLGIYSVWTILCCCSSGCHFRTEGRALSTNEDILRAKRKVRDIVVHELQFADDCALVAHSLEDLQEITSHFVSAAKDFGLTIGLKKTEVLYQPAPGSIYVEPTVLIDDTHLSPVTKFCYLGSIMSSSASLDLEVESRTRIASFAFGQLKDNIWSHNIRLTTKWVVYRAVVTSALLYGCEAWCPDQRHLCQIDQLQQHQLDQHYMVKYGPQHWGPFPSWNANSHNHGVVSQTVLGWTCKNAWWKTAQGHHVWSTVLWCPQTKGATTKIQGCSTQEPQESQHCPFIIGGPGTRHHTVEECSQERCGCCWEEAQGSNRGKVQKMP